MSLNPSIRVEIIQDHQRIMAAKPSEKVDIIQIEFKKLVKTNLEAIDYYFILYLENKKIQQYRYSIFNDLGIFVEQELLQSCDVLHLQDFIHNYYEPNIFAIIDDVNDILHYLNNIEKDYIKNDNILKLYQKFAKLCIQYTNIKSKIIWHSSSIKD